MPSVSGPILMVLAAATIAAQQPPPISFELKEAKFDTKKLDVKDLNNDVGCPKDGDLPKFGEECPVEYICTKAGAFQVATTGLGVGAAGARFRFVVQQDRDAEPKCWRGRLEGLGSSGESTLGSARFTVRRGSVHEDGEVGIFVQGNSALEELSKEKICPGWTLGVGSSGSCTLSPAWQHPEYRGKILGCAWSDRSKTIASVTPCSPASDQAATDAIRRKGSGQTVLRGKGIALNLESQVPWSKWMEAFQGPLDPPPDRSVDVTVYYRFFDGGPVQDQTFAVAYRVASPWYLLLGCLIFGSAIGSGLGEYAKDRQLKIGVWFRPACVLSAYGIVLWAVLYWIKGRIGLMQTELRLDQAVPVGLFGLVIGFRGLKFVVDWLLETLGSRTAKAAKAALLLAAVELAPGLEAARPSRTPPRQLVAIAGQVMLVTDEGIHRVDGNTGDLTQLARFVPGAIAGGAAAGFVQIDKGEPRELLFVSLVLPGGRVVVDQYLPDGRQSGNRLLDLRLAGADFVGAPPLALAWDRGAQRLYVACASGAVWSYPFGGDPQRLAMAKVSLSAFALDEPGRRLFAADVGNGRVLMLDLSQPTAGLTAFADDSPLASPWALAYDGESRSLYVADEHRNTVFVLKVPPRPLRPLKTRWRPWIDRSYEFLKGNGFGDPVAIAIADRRLWIADREARKVFPVDLISRKQYTPVLLK